MSLLEHDEDRPALDGEQAVRERYSEAARERLPELCCPVEYDRRYLAVIPQEIIDRDYGCGDPSKHVRPGETVLDLGSGGGKICYIAAQVVGSQGRVIGVDFNDTMLELARAHRQAIGDRLGYHNVSFRKGRIQDLRLNHETLDERLRQHPVTSAAQLDELDAWTHDLRESDPLIGDGTIDVVVSNCVLNLVRNDDKQQLFRELHRVLRSGGRAVISDVVADESVPDHLQRDSELWSGCLSGAWREDLFLAAFADAGFYGMRVVGRDPEPWQVIEGIEFRSITVEAYKGKEGVRLERNQAVIYKGPWRSVTDDDGHTLIRGQRAAVCDKTFGIFTRPPYEDQIVAVPPREEIPLDQAATFDGSRDPLRDPHETKGWGYKETRTRNSSGCGPEGCC